MGKIVDYKCNHSDYKAFNARQIESWGLSMPEIFTDAEQMAEYARKDQEANGNTIIKLPYDFYLQAEAVGADIKCERSKLGVSKKGDAVKNIAEIASLPPLDVNYGRIAETFKACDALRADGKKVAIHLRGLMDTLSAFMEVQNVIMGMMMQKNDLPAVSDKTRQDVLTFALEAQKHCDILFYEDSTGGVNILGPKMAEMLTNLFTYPLMKELEEQLDPDMKVLLCPKTSLMLTGTDQAEFVDVNVSGDKYADICLQMPAEARFIGQICNRLLDQPWTKNVTYLKLR